MPGRVLMVAYNFPPVGGTGVQRTLKYVTYLPRSGWEPVVLTARNPGKSPRDEEAERHLPPDLVVERAFSPEPVKLRRALGRTARSLFARSGGGTSGGDGSAAAAGQKTAVGGTMPWAGRLQSLWGAAVGLTCFPDEEVGWVPFAIQRGLEIDRCAPVDAIYSSSGPVSCHLVAAMVAHRTGLPWIADFRDPWIGNAFAAPLPAAHARLQRRIERRIVHLADRSVFATASLAEDYAARYPGAASRFLAIPNGYDRAEVAGVRPAPYEPGRFHLLFAGSLYRTQELEVFLRGVEQLVGRRPDIRRRLRVHFLGKVNEANRRVGSEFARPERLGDVISFEAFVPRPEALARIAGADALLQLMPDLPGAEINVGGKLLEYLAFDKPILAVMPQGEGRRIVDGVPVGRSADVNPDSVAAALERLVDDPPAPGASDPAGRYDRVNLTRELAELMDEVVAERKAARL